MKRTITIAIAVTMLVGAAAAFAALNTNTASYSFSGKAGSAKSPAAVGYKVTYTAANATPGNRAAPLTKIVSKIYGLTSNGKYFPKCSLKTIGAKPNYNAACPKGSLIASGQVYSLLGPGSSLAGPGGPCNPHLAVYNGGQNVQNFFFYVKSGTDCGSLRTGASAPWQGRIKQTGGYSVETIPLPPDISTKAGNLNGVYGSLIRENVTYPNLKVRVHGKTIPYNASIGCKGHSRPYSVAFTATDGHSSTTTTVKGSAKC